MKKDNRQQDDRLETLIGYFQSINHKLDFVINNLNLLVAKQTGITDEERVALKEATAKMKTSADALEATLQQNKA